MSTPLPAVETPVRILVAVDGSPASVHASAIVTRIIPGPAQIRLVTVLSFDRYPYSFVGDDLSDVARREEAVADEVESAQGPPRHLFTRVYGHAETTYRFGHAPDEIAEEIVEWDPDLVVLGRRGLKGPARWLGSVSEHVLRRAKCPVLLIPAGPEGACP